MTAALTEPETARYLLARWASWWWHAGGAPDRLPNALQVRTALVLYAPDAGPYDPVDLLREWATWWATSNAAPPEMPDALNVRTAGFLAKWALVELQEAGALPAGVSVCPLCFLVSADFADNQGEYCRRCITAYFGSENT